MGDWMKVEKATPDKPEIAILARKLGVSIGEAFLEWFRLYAWADDMTSTGTVPDLSLGDADKLARVMPRTAEHLASKQIGWVKADAKGVTFDKWDRHNSKSAKTRDLEAEKKRKQREKKAAMSPECPDVQGTESRAEREESERRPTAIPANGKANGSANGSTAAAADRDQSLLRSQRYFQMREGRMLAKLDDLDWSRVCSMADKAGRMVPALSDDDRRQWLRYAVLAATAFSESWLIGSAEAVVNAKETKRTKQAHFVGVLKARAADSGQDNREFLKMLGSIEIPDEVWQSSVLGGPK